MFGKPEFKDPEVVHTTTVMFSLPIVYDHYKSEDEIKETIQTVMQARLGEALVYLQLEFPELTMKVHHAN